ncbi:targeting protein for Xklp2-like isoform X1 [Hypanus sabinus]|uniref:targeting protein for Xklp2-like isoform X1 n=1 Tax=Hypanus sabinus TaxID=79690 RepID=UPI0028C4ACA6|nr:targeting protein for Xklp2-like isoform X1 [Hypanus sabinus]
MENSAKIILPVGGAKRGVPMVAVNPTLRIEENDEDAESVDNEMSFVRVDSLSFTSSAEVTENSFSHFGSAALSPDLLDAEDISDSGDTSTTTAGNREEFMIHRRPRLTQPKTPMVLKRSKTNQRSMSSEERELLLISQLQRETEEHRKLNEAMYLSIFFRGRITTRSSVPAADTLSKASLPRVQQEYKEFNFVNELRKYPLLTPMKKECTVPKPFSLLTSARKECRKTCVDQYVSVAEYINKLQHYTQPRSRRRPICQETSANVLDCIQAPVPDTPSEI